MAARIRSQTVIVVDCGYPDRHPLHLLHFRHSLLPIHIQPRADATSTLFQKSDSVGNFKQFEIISWTDVVDAPLVPS